MKPDICIIGGGLAGSEAAWQLVQAGVPVTLHEMRPHRATEVHETSDLAELVCSNSFRSDNWEYNAIGLLHEEMRRCGSLILAAADNHRVPAGSALALDRRGFSGAVTRALSEHPLVTLERGEVTELPTSDDGLAIIATGPLTSAALSRALLGITGQDHLAFFDAIAPIIYTDSIDFSIAWRQSRWEEPALEGNSTGDYINLPLTRAQYHTFIEGLLTADKVEFRDWEKSTPYFEGCLPIEVMAERGIETPAHGPMKPVGLRNPHSDEPLHAVVQLRQDNALGSLYNMVGFQTKLSHGDQVELFRTLPGLEHAKFARLGGLHRNTFINSPQLLDSTLAMKRAPHLHFAGQISGVEGYVESAAIGLLAGRFIAAKYRGATPVPPPPTTALGALLTHITTDAEAATFQPMNINFGLLPPIAGKKRRERRKAVALRALADLQVWISDSLNAAAAQ